MQHATTSSRPVRVLFLAFAALALGACNSGGSGQGGGVFDGERVESVQITPANAPTIAAGTELQFTATALITDIETGAQRTQDVTTLVDWSSSLTAIASIDDSGLALGRAAGDTEITATLGRVSDSQNLRVTAAVVTALQVSPAQASQVAGRSTQFAAVATLSTGSTQIVTNSASWSSSNSGVATVDDQGLATAVAAGTATITATLQGESGQAQYTVTAAELEGLSVSPAAASVPKGVPTSFAATGEFSDGSSDDISDEVNWTSTDTSVATVDAQGQVTTLAEGSTTILASLGGFTDSGRLTVTAAELDRIDITPMNDAISAGRARQLTATGIFTDGSNVVLTDSVIWSSSNPDVADVSNAEGSKGLVAAKTPGMVSIQAAMDDITGSTGFTVTDAVLQSISVSPEGASVPPGFEQQYTATGRFSDNSTDDITDEVAWSSNDTAVITISNGPGSKGVATAQAAGMTAVVATLSGISDAASVTVPDATLDSLAVSPVDPSIPDGLTQQFTATGNFSDGSSFDVTRQVDWASDDTDVASIDDAGLATAQDPGSAGISATRDGVTDATTLTVTDAVLTDIEVSPVAASVAAGRNVDFTATGTFSDGQTADITDSVTWQSSDTDVATISNADGSRGVATGQAPGEADITASADGVTSNAARMTVTDAVLESLVVTPEMTSTPEGRSVQFTAEGTFSDGSVADLTEEATWSSSDESIATVSNAAGERGLATGLQASATAVSITAEVEGISDAGMLTVTDAVVESVQVTPQDPSVPNGSSQVFAAEAQFSDGSMMDVTKSADTTWASSNPNVATVSNSGDTKGTAVAVGEGTTSISATFDGVEGTSVLTVTDAVLTGITVDAADAAGDADDSLPVGFQQQYRATGSFSDGSSRDITEEVTWSAFNTAVVSISNAEGQRGLASGVAAGSTTLQASRENSNGDLVSGTITALVTDDALDSIAATPEDATIGRGEQLQYTAVGSFASGNRLLLTRQLSWSSSDTGVATVSNADGSKGLATASESFSLMAESTTITATRVMANPANNISGSTELTVSGSLAP